jgi:thioredoxin 1
MELQTRLKHIHSEAEFRQVLEEHPEARIIRKLTGCRGFMRLPFTVYFKKSAMVKATTIVQSQDQIESILNTYF